MISGMNKRGRFSYFFFINHTRNLERIRFIRAGNEILRVLVPFSQKRKTPTLTITLPNAAFLANSTLIDTLLSFVYWKV